MFPCSLIFYADYFDIEFKSQTCNGGDACSSGFIRMDKEFYIKEKEISYRINEDIDINEIKKNNPYKKLENLLQKDFL